MTALVQPLDDTLSALGARLREGAGAQRVLREQREAADRQAREARAEAALIEEVVAYFAAVRELLKERLETSLSSIVSDGLTRVYGEPLQLVIELDDRADLPVARFRLRDERGLETELIEARGGGLVNIASFLLKVRLIMGMVPEQARVLALDEPFVNVDGVAIDAVCALLRRIAHEGGFQVIVITQRTDLSEAADLEYRFSQVEGVTEIALVRGPEEEIAQGGP